MTGLPQTQSKSEGVRLFCPPCETERSKFVRAGFAAAAPFYDVLTRLFSFGLDGRWRRCCLDACQLRPGEFILDVATGTGELVIEGANRVSPRGRVAGLDACGEMLVEARRKVGHVGKRIAWVQGKAESFPFKEELFDCLTVGFALRHVSDLIGTLKEMVRVLKPGGRLGVVEFTRPEGAISRFLLFAYLHVVVPPLVGVLSRSWLTFHLARYLPATIERFQSTEELRRSLEEAGLTVVLVQRYMAGSVSVCMGLKPNLDHSAPAKHPDKAGW